MSLVNLAENECSLELAQLNSERESILSRYKTACLNYFLVTAGLVVLITTLWGVYSHFSPVPFWDMWDGYLRFYLQVLNQDHSAWFQQHNEHRIFLSRILFWLDLRYFQGLGAFLICANLLIQLGTALLFCNIVSERMKTDKYKIGLFCFVPCLLFSWIQNNNLTWAFQSQFLFVNLFALLSFWNLSLFATECKTMYFCFAVLTGCCATFSMANGLLVFPLLIVQALLQRIPKRSLLTLVLIGAGVIGFYFHDYHKPSGHASSLENLLAHPLQVVQFTLTYLGSPFASVLKQIQLVTLAGLLMLAGSGVFFFFIWKNRRFDRVNLALFLFLLFILGTASATATGRVNFGLQAATESRYTTPALMGWVSFILIGFVNHTLIPMRLFLVLKTALVGIPLLLLPAQLKAFDDFSQTAFVRKIAILGLSQQHYDQIYARQVYPYKGELLDVEIMSPQELLDVAKMSQQEGLSVFSSSWTTFPDSQIPLDLVRHQPCMGKIESIEPFQSGAAIHYRLKGWVWDAESGTVPENIILADSTGRVIGFGLSGEPKPEIAVESSGVPVKCGWQAYLNEPFFNCPIYAYALKGAEFVPLSGEPVRLNESALISEISEWKWDTASQLKVLSTDWEDDIYAPIVKEKKAKQILKSGLSGDTFAGEVEVKTEVPTDSVSFVYMTGPDAGHQNLAVYDSNGKLANQFELPESPFRWSKITVKMKTKDQVKLVLSDSGTSWGQWSAVLFP